MAGLPDTAGCYLWVLWTLDSEAAESRAAEIRRVKQERGT